MYKRGMVSNWVDNILLDGYVDVTYNEDTTQLAILNS